jgi:hypothetical protein
MTADDEPASLAGRLGGLALSAGKTLGCVFGCGYIGVCALLYVFQRKLQYFPTKDPPPSVSSLPAVCRDIEEFTVRTEDGETLRGWYWAPVVGAKHADVTLLQLHGNAGSRHNRLYWAHHVRNFPITTIRLPDRRDYLHCLLILWSTVYLFQSFIHAVRETDTFFCIVPGAFPAGGRCGVA